MNSFVDIGLELCGNAKSLFGGTKNCPYRNTYKCTSRISISCYIIKRMNNFKIAHFPNLSLHQETLKNIKINNFMSNIK